MAVIEDAIKVYKNEVVFYDKSEKGNEKHYRLTPDKIVHVYFDYAERKVFFGLKTELVERIAFTINDPDIPKELEVYEHREPNFHRFRGGLRTFIDENKIPLDIIDINGNPQA